MGKSSRIVLLSVTCVVAIAVFLVLWTVRPNSNSTLIADARARQSQGLVTVDTTIDTEEAKAALLADASFIDELAATLAGNEALRTSLKESLAGQLADELRDDFLNEAEILARDAAADLIEGYITEQLDAINASIDGRIQAWFDENVGQLDAVINNAIQAYVDAHYDELIEIINSEVDVQRIANSLVEAIWADLETYLATIDIEGLVASVEAEAASAHDALVADANSYTDQQVKNLAEGMLTRSDVQSMVDESRRQIMDDIEASQSRVVSVPDFSTSPVVRTESDYAAVREAERQGAIQALLNALARN